MSGSARTPIDKILLTSYFFSMKTKVSSKGQVVIPKAYRQKLGWVAGTELEVSEEAGQVLLKPQPSKKKKYSIRDVAGILHRPGMKASTVEEMDEAVSKMFEDWEV
jgi:AbrB family looped-hinge helix DNA binding protein